MLHTVRAAVMNNKGHFHKKKILGMLPVTTLFLDGTYHFADFCLVVHAKSLD